MKIEEKFNLKSATPIDARLSAVSTGPQYPTGVKLQFFAVDPDDRRTISWHVTPDEALQLAAELIAAYRKSKQ